MAINNTASEIFTPPFELEFEEHLNSDSDVEEVAPMMKGMRRAETRRNRRMSQKRNTSVLGILKCKMDKKSREDDSKEKFLKDSSKPIACKLANVKKRCKKK